MSAFMCSDEHIAVLAYSATFGTDSIEAHPRFYKDLKFRKAFNTLRAANMRAMRARYGKERGVISPPTFNAATVASVQAHRDPVHVIKLAGCFDYQACEHDGWERSEAYRVLGRAVLRCAHSQLPGYSNAPWAL